MFCFVKVRWHSKSRQIPCVHVTNRAIFVPHTFFGRLRTRPVEVRSQPGPPPKEQVDCRSLALPPTWSTDRLGYRTLLQSWSSNHLSICQFLYLRCLSRLNATACPVWPLRPGKAGRFPIRRVLPPRPFLRLCRISFAAVLNWRRKQPSVRLTTPVHKPI